MDGEAVAGEYDKRAAFDKVCPIPDAPGPKTSNGGSVMTSCRIHAVLALVFSLAALPAFGATARSMSWSGSVLAAGRDAPLKPNREKGTNFHA
ncbi:MAG TPA: hypothetical protein VHP37_20115 [Burkholderiales bacterium]|nr:hypothetical protein [Burkholderiales bacterium]